MRIIFFIVGLFMILATPCSVILIVKRGTQLDTIGQGMLWMLAIVGLLAGSVVIYLTAQSNDNTVHESSLN